MECENMRTSIRKAYPAIKWKYRVDHMSNEQVIAVYFALQKRSKLPGQQKRKPHYVITEYYCHACKVSYTRDNPDLTECEFCGSTDIAKLYMTNF